jgi:hypothetical protein
LNTCCVVVGCLTDAVEFNDCLNAAGVCEQRKSTVIDGNKISDSKSAVSEQKNNGKKVTRDEYIGLVGVSKSEQFSEPRC